MRRMKTIISVSMSIAGMWLCATSCQEGDKMDEPEYQEVEKAAVMTNGVTRTEAMDVAATFSAGRFGMTGKPASRSMQSVETITGANGEPVAYVVNTDGAGWVIVSATKDYHPILAYSDNAEATFHLNGNERNTGVAVWMDEVSTAIAESGSLDSLTTAAIAMEWAEYTPETQSMIGGGATGLPGGNSEEAVKCRERLKELNETYYQEGWSFVTLPNVTGAVLPSSVYTIADNCGSPYEYTIVGIKDVSQRTNVPQLLSTQWGQAQGFNALCPNGSKAGCGPIAMAQLMYFHKIPTSFDWNNMWNDIATYATQLLIADIGKVIDADYGSGSTSSKIENVKKGFEHYGYIADVKDHDNFNVIYNMGTYKNPVFMAGQEGGLNPSKHMWVCDGVSSNLAEYMYYVEYLNSAKDYTNYGETLMENPGVCGGSSYTTFHMNYGWYGTYDGWYTQPTPDKEYTHNRKNIYVKIK